MSVSYYASPRLLFFIKEGRKVNFAEFRAALEDFLKTNLEIKDRRQEYSPSHYEEPNRDNQFIGGYRRSVYETLDLAGGQRISIQFFDEESDEADFVSRHIFSFYSFSIYFLDALSWDRLEACWQLFKPFLEAQGFYDASFRYTYGVGLYAHFEASGDVAGMEGVKAATISDLRKYLLEEVSQSIDIQGKPFLDINALLAELPDKTKIRQLTLTHNGLHQLPSKIWEMTALESLYLHHNQIAQAEEGFKKLSALSMLHIASNPITENPSELARLQKMLPPDCRLISGY